MTTLKSVLHGLHYQWVGESLDIPVHTIQVHSGLVNKGDLFVAVKGYSVDGHTFINQALLNGAGSILLQDRNFIPGNKARPFVLVNDSRAALPALAANYYGNPADQLQLTGVTGTNGKTTTASLIKAVLESYGIKSGLIGTIAYLIGNENFGAGLSTPDSLTLHYLFSEMVARKVPACVMEVTSHAIKQKRVEGLNFREAVFTNISHEHLDYHESFAEYIATKAELFRGLNKSSIAILNRDSEHFNKFKEATSAGQIITYSLHDAKADVYAALVKSHADMTFIRISTPCGVMEICSRLPGEYNCANILAAVATGIAKDIPITTITEGIESVKGIKGRFERVHHGQDYDIIIDYAHTPDALENVLTTISTWPHGKIITVFGCDSKPDKSKRAMMGEVVSRLSDLTILTTDNPRHEDPEAIISEIAQGIMPGREWNKQVDRKSAIHYALSQASLDDTVLIAGKGHENFQEINDTRNYYDDRDSIREYFADGQADRYPEKA